MSTTTQSRYHHRIPACSPATRDHLHTFVCMTTTFRSQTGHMHHSAQPRWNVQESISLTGRSLQNNLDRYEMIELSVRRRAAGIISRNSHSDGYSTNNQPGPFGQKSQRFQAFAPSETGFRQNDLNILSSVCVIFPKKGTNIGYFRGIPAPGLFQISGPSSRFFSTLSPAVLSTGPPLCVRPDS